MQKEMRTIVLALLFGTGGGWLYQQLQPQEIQNPLTIESTATPYHLSNYTESAVSRAPVNEDFVAASKLSTPSVVYIKTASTAGYGSSWYDLFFNGGGRSNQTISSGSGVIFSKDGYIMTNNHVIDKAEAIEVIHNKRSYAATLIGTDPNTDLAVLKIEGENLPAAKLGSSRALEVGEWVLAVGNPFNLTSTVTAGIVSAKSREINILDSKFPLESFIQTDAAINPGNSGGALVNNAGELIGINTAILSRTGSYTGYGFAVPVDIAKKVFRDLTAYGEVQKAFVGTEVVDIDRRVAEELSLEDYDGVVAIYIHKDGAAQKAGMKKGDVILAVNGEAIDSRSEFEELMSYHSPGDEIKIRYKRGQKTAEAHMVLTNKEGTTDILKSVVYNSQTLGVDLENVPKIERDMLEISAGVRVSKVHNGFFKRLRIGEGAIITSINNVPIESASQLEDIIHSAKGKVIIEGLNSKGSRFYNPYYF